MHCPRCHRAMISTSSQAIEDDKGAMTITRWRCRPCHETAEEIWLSTGYRGPDPIRIRYAVAPLRKCRIPAARRGVCAHAGAL
jgi:transposase-like protein